MIEKVSDFAEAVVTGVSRRRFLARISGWGAGLAALLTGSRVGAQAQPQFCVYVVINAVSSEGFSCEHEEGDVLCLPCRPNTNACNDNVTCVCKKIINKEEKNFCTLTLSKLTVDGHPVTPTCADCPRGTTFTTVDQFGKAKMTMPKDVSKFCNCM